MDGKHTFEWERLASAGVDGIISDDPAALIAWLKANGKRWKQNWPQNKHG